MKFKELFEKTSQKYYYLITDRNTKEIFAVTGEVRELDRDAIKKNKYQSYQDFIYKSSDRAAEDLKEFSGKNMAVMTIELNADPLETAD